MGNAFDAGRRVSMRSLLSKKPYGFEQYSLLISVERSIAVNRPPKARFRCKIGYLSVVALCLLGVPLLAQETPANRPYPVVPAKEGERCTVCRAALGKDDVALIVRGRRVPLGRLMVDTFLANEEKYFAEKQPKAALFQE